MSFKQCSYLFFLSFVSCIGQNGNSANTEPNGTSDTSKIHNNSSKDYKSLSNNSHYSFKEDSMRLVVSREDKEMDACLSKVKYASIDYSDPVKVVQQFYDWYLPFGNKGLWCFQSQRVFYKGNGHFQLDTVDYDARLRNCGFFSNDFINKEGILICNCNKTLKKVSLSEVLSIGDGSAGSDCDFFSTDHWLASQEPMDSIKITDSKVEKDVANISLYTISSGEKYANFKVYLIKENNKWKISQIQAV